MVALLQTLNSQAQGAYLGEIRIFAGNSAPDGWALCEGQELNVSQYSALYALIGNNYGGTANLTFNLPDLRGRVPVSSGAGPGLSNITLGSKFGSNTTTLVTSNLPAHNHTVSGTTTAPTTNNPTGAVLADTSILDLEYAAAATANVLMAPTGITGSSEPFSNMQPSLGVTYIICVKAGLSTAASGANTDITSLSGLTTALSVAQGGTGQTTYTDGQILVGNSTGNSLSKTTLTAGTGIIVSNAAGAITISKINDSFRPQSFVNEQFTYSVNGGYNIFTVPANVYKVTIEIIGGSGGGGGGGGKSATTNTTSPGGGGGGGGGAEYAGIILDVTPGGQISWTLGAGGAAGAAGTSTVAGKAGGNGGKTSVIYKATTILTAAGGAGGTGGGFMYTTGYIGQGGMPGGGSSARQSRDGLYGLAGDKGGTGGKNGAAVTNHSIDSGGNGGLGKTSTGSGSGTAGSYGYDGWIAISYYL